MDCSGVVTMDSKFLLENFVTIIGATLSAGGLWSFLDKRPKKKTDETQILLGLAQDRIVTLGKKYIKRGWIDHDEYYQFLTYLYLPYRNLGGNGMCEKVFKDVTNLPMVNPNTKFESE